MNRDDLIRWATQCKMPYDYVTGEIVHLEKLEAFAALVAAAEREACAKLVDDMWTGYGDLGAICSAAIRARGQE